MGGVSFIEWCQLHPGTRAIGSRYLSDTDMTSLDRLELFLEFDDPNDYDYEMYSDLITVDLQ